MRCFLFLPLSLVTIPKPQPFCYICLSAQSSGHSYIWQNVKMPLRYINQTRLTFLMYKQTLKNSTFDQKVNVIACKYDA